MQDAKIEFENIACDKIKDCFRKVVSRYTPLAQNRIILTQRALGKTTMQAQPIINKHFWHRERRAYQVQCNHRTQVDDPTNISNLPEEVLEGWFAHELGHVLDYHNRNWPDLIGLGIMYLVNPAYKRKAEHQADLYAIDYGFAEQIIATKHYILDHSDIPAVYKARIKRFYMSPENVKKIIEEKEQSILSIDDATLL